MTQYEEIILGLENVQVKRCLNLNPATLLPEIDTESKDENETHDCIMVTEFCTKPREDILDIPLQDPKMMLFVDGSCFRDCCGVLKAAYAVCTRSEERSCRERV